MKKVLLISLASLSLVNVQAQLFTPESLSGALLGGIAGGIIGHNSGRRTAEGIGIGAGAGLVLGALAHQSSEYAAGPYYAPGGPPYYSGYYAYPPSSFYVYEPRRPNYAITGAALGGLAGGIIGHNSGRRTAEGAAIGAGAGLLLGSLAEHQARQRERSYMEGTQRYLASAPNLASPHTAPTLDPNFAAPLAPAAATSQIVNADSRSPSAMGAANRLFGR